MPNQNKNLIKQSAIILAALVICWGFSYLRDYYFYENLLLFSSALFVYTSLFVAILYLRMKNKKEIKMPNRLFRFGMWVSTSLLLLSFVLWSWVNSYWSDLTLIQNIKFRIFISFSPSYWLDLDYGLIYDIGEYAPYLIMIGLIAWVLKINSRMIKDYKELLAT